jgi:hypothetical protein
VAPKSIVVVEFGTEPITLTGEALFGRMVRYGCDRVEVNSVPNAVAGPRNADAPVAPTMLAESLVIVGLGSVGEANAAEPLYAFDDPVTFHVGNVATVPAGTAATGRALDSTAAAAIAATAPALIPAESAPTPRPYAGAPGPSRIAGPGTLAR